MTPSGGRSAARRTRAGGCRSPVSAVRSELGLPAEAERVHGKDVADFLRTEADPRMPVARGHPRSADYRPISG